MPNLIIKFKIKKIKRYNLIDKKGLAKLIFKK